MRVRFSLIVHLLCCTTEWNGKSLEEIINGAYDANTVAQNGIFNNISQLWNHIQFWEMMGTGDNAMRGDLVSRIYGVAYSNGKGKGAPAPFMSDRNPAYPQETSSRTKEHSTVINDTAQKLQAQSNPDFAHIF